MTPVVFVDTDVILDLLMERTPHFADAARFFTRIQAGEVRAYTSGQSFANIHYLLARSLGRQAALEALRKLRLLLRVLPVDERAVDTALASGFADFEDALQHAVAVEGKAQAIITRNKSDYRHAMVPVLSAAEYVRG